MTIVFTRPARYLKVKLSIGHEDKSMKRNWFFVPIASFDKLAGLLKSNCFDTRGRYSNSILLIRVPISFSYIEIFLDIISLVETIFGSVYKIRPSVLFSIAIH